MKKNYSKLILSFSFKTYIAWSIFADIMLLGTVIYLIFR